MRMSTGTLGSLSLALSVVMAAPAWSQERVGVVTTVIGPVTVARAAAPAEPLKFKDDIFLRDRVTTGDAAMTRILMGGKVVVTARERSTLTITEVPGLSTIDLTSGRIAVAVDKTRMKPGERVDVRTPNAIAGVRGTVLIVETLRNTSSVTVLSGLVEVVRLDPTTGRGIGPVTPVGPQQAVTVRSNVLPPRPQTVSRDRAQQLSQEFTPPIRTVDATSVMPVKDEVARATAMLNQIMPTGGGRVATANGPVTATSAAAMPKTSTVASSTLAKPTTTLMPITTTLLPTTNALPTAPMAPLGPTTSTMPISPPLLQPILQPLVPPLVQNVVQPVLQPVTNLLK
jgi:FecR protein